MLHPLLIQSPRERRGSGFRGGKNDNAFDRRNSLRTPRVYANKLLLRPDVWDAKVFNERLVRALLDEYLLFILLLPERTYKPTKSHNCFGSSRLRGLWRLSPSLTNMAPTKGHGKQLEGTLTRNSRPINLHCVSPHRRPEPSTLWWDERTERVNNRPGCCLRMCALAFADVDLPFWQVS